MTTEQETKLKALYLSWPSENREKYAQIIIQAGLIGAEIKNHPTVKTFIKNGLLTAGRKNINPTPAGYLLLEMTETGKTFLSLGKK